MPIAEKMYSVLYEGLRPQEALTDLMERKLKGRVMGFFNLFGNKKERKNRRIFEKIKQAVRQTQENFTERIQDLVDGTKGNRSATCSDELEAIMIGADIGVTTTNEILDSIRDQVSRKTLQDPASCAPPSRRSCGRFSTSTTQPPKQIDRRRTVCHPHGRRQWCR